MRHHFDYCNTLLNVHHVTKCTYHISFFSVNADVIVFSFFRYWYLLFFANLYFILAFFWFIDAKSLITTHYPISLLPPYYLHVTLLKRNHSPFYIIHYLNNLNDFWFLKFQYFQILKIPFCFFFICLTNSQPFLYPNYLRVCLHKCMVNPQFEL